MIHKFQDFLKESTNDSITFIDAAVLALKQNDNKPMTAKDIWNYISNNNITRSKGKTPWITLNTVMSRFSRGTQIDLDIQKRNPDKIEIFEIVQRSPMKFILLNDSYSKSLVKSDKDIENYVQNEEETEETVGSKNQAVRNPFGGENKKAGDPYNSSALFVVGESGSGKSTRIIPLLRKSGHKIIVIGSENAPSPNLLFEYDQKDGFVPSDIAEFIIAAKSDPKNFYTIVFDECHEYIDEIKRSILHAISHKRGEVRFFGVKKLARHFFDTLETYETTSKIVPDNVGFIFISSKPDVFEYHDDFMGRVDKVVVKREDPYPYPDIKYIQNLLDRQDQL